MPVQNVTAMSATANLSALFRPDKPSETVLFISSTTCSGRSISNDPRPYFSLPNQLVLLKLRLAELAPSQHLDACRVPSGRTAIRVSLRATVLSLLQCRVRKDLGTLRTSGPT